MPARRYLVVVQAAQGFPKRGEPPAATPPDGPAQPMVHTAVLEADYLALERRCEELEAITGKIPHPQLARIMEMVAAEEDDDA